MSTLRQQLHTACSLAEVAKADLHAAEVRYEQARDHVNEIIDRLAPLNQPDGVVSDVQRQSVLNGSKIRLIKLVRTATSQFMKQEPKPVDATCMGLKEAKDLVEQWLEGRMP